MALCMLALHMLSMYMLAPCATMRHAPLRCATPRCVCSCRSHAKHKYGAARIANMVGTNLDPSASPPEDLDSIYLIYECVYDSNAHSSLVYLYRSASSTTTYPAHYKDANCNYTARSSLNCPPLRTWAPFLALDAAHRERTPSRRAVAPHLRTLGSCSVFIASHVDLRLPLKFCFRLPRVPY